jgi:hypothetical protein
VFTVHPAIEVDFAYVLKRVVGCFSNIKAQKEGSRSHGSEVGHKEVPYPLESH